MNKGILFAFLMLLAACEKNEVCNTTQLTVESLETMYGCQNTIRGLDFDLADTHTIIRTQNDFESQVTGDCIPEVDFERYDLVIGKKQLSRGVENIEYDYSRDCNGAHHLHVAIKNNDAMEAPNITYHALVPKLAPEQTVTINVELKY